MPNSASFIEAATERLSEYGAIRTKRMFGGHGFYLDGLFVAIVDDDRLYLKVSKSDKEIAEQADLAPFTYSKSDGRLYTMNYYEVSLDQDLSKWIKIAKKAAETKTK